MFVCRLTDAAAAAGNRTTSKETPPHGTTWNMRPCMGVFFIHSDFKCVYAKRKEWGGWGKGDHAQILHVHAHLETNTFRILAS